MTSPVDRSTNWPYEDGSPGRFSYARTGHPTGEAVEEELGRLDGGRALLFPSGMSAATTVLLTLARPDGLVALAEGSYYGTGVLFRLLEPWGVRVVEFDQTGPPPADAALVWVEAPANPMLTMPDLDAATAFGVPVVCDSTVATPLATAPARARLRRRAAQRDEVPRRPRRRPRRGGGRARRRLYDRLRALRARRPARSPRPTRLRSSPAV